MIAKQIPTNPIMKYMQYIGEDLTITFNKGQQRTYHGVPKEIAYKLYYKESASEFIGFYSTNIKKKYKVTVKK